MGSDKFCRAGILVALIGSIFRTHIGLGKPEEPISGNRKANVTIFKARDPKHLTLAFVPTDGRRYWAIAAKGVHEFEREHDIHVEIKFAVGLHDAQNRVINSLLEKHCDGIAVCPIEPDQQPGFLNAIAGKTNLILFNADVPQSGRIAAICTDERIAGFKLASEIVKSLPHGGKAALFAGYRDATVTRERRAGIEAAFQGHNIEIVAERFDGTHTERAREEIDSLIRSTSDLDVAIGLFSYEGPLISDAIKRSGRKGKLFGASFGYEETLDGIRDGYIKCVCTPRPFNIGYLTTKWMYDLAINGDSVALPKDGLVDAGVTIVTADTLVAFKRELAELWAGT